MVVTDDNFASIAAAVEEGRAIYDNIVKAVHFLLSCNISEVLVVFLATLFGFPMPLLPVQILWINLVTDGFSALALAVDPSASDLMKRQPRGPKAKILDKHRMTLMFGQGLFMAVIVIGAFTLTLYGLRQDLDQARTVTFTALVIAQLSHAFNCRSDRFSIFSLGWGTNPHLLWAVGGSMLLQVGIVFFPQAGIVFQTAYMDTVDWLIILGCGILPIMAVEGWKSLKRKHPS